MSAQVTKSDFTGQLITIRSDKSFAEVTAEIERLFRPYNPERLRALIEAGDAGKLAAYAKEVGEPTGFGIFYQLDMGSMMKIAGIPIESRFYLFGNAATGQNLFRYSGTAGLGAPTRFCVSQRGREKTRIDIDLPSSFFSQFPDLSASQVPAQLDARMIPLLESVAA